ncbi:MAG TPA: ACT domain-containing protein [Acidobacteriota bacterium]|nr:ACT domain-containing protein [Acidobacteriota bacterium]
MKKIALRTDDEICKFTIHAVPDRPGAAAELFERLGSEGISVHMMAASGAEAGHSDISLTIGRGDAPRAAKILQKASTELEAGSVSEKGDVVAISLVADELHREPGVAGRMFRTLSAQGINIEMVSAANTAVICLIDSRFLEAAKDALCAEFKAVVGC